MGFEESLRLAFWVFVALCGPITLVGALVISSLLVSTISGWPKLAEHYGFEGEFEGQQWRAKTGRLGRMRYRRQLIIGSNPEGLHLTVFPWLRIGHPPVFMPWVDITATEMVRFGLVKIVFEFRAVPSVNLEIPKKLGDQILSARATPRWE